MNPIALAIVVVIALALASYSVGVALNLQLARDPAHPEKPTRFTRLITLGFSALCGVGAMGFLDKVALDKEYDVTFFELIPIGVIIGLAVVELGGLVYKLAQRRAESLGVTAVTVCPHCGQKLTDKPA